MKEIRTQILGIAHNKNITVMLKYYYSGLPFRLLNPLKLDRLHNTLIKDIYRNVKRRK